ncbi:ABC transporter substrate-binding protein [Frankia sp. AgB32]|uniref:ABC transporter substrate-binding protein n=1 Tax=Frankia sp. AgB32 TaxID=631119 RepID=UPI0020105529|nr:ABC transporter substrate-binding protein [Frankia sp. AgB32]MCK9898346.1 ABC transporter substrate-binding protein [Frankia sp. AgB32]
MKAGLPYPATGTGSDALASARAGIEARFAGVNVAGGVNGRCIVDDWRDEQAVQETNVVMARELVEQEHVCAPEQRDSKQTLAFVGYIVAGMFIRGLQAAGKCPTRQNFIAGLRTVKNYPAGDLISAVDLERDFGRVAECYAFVSVNNTGSRP